MGDEWNVFVQITCMGIRTAESRAQAQVQA